MSEVIAGFVGSEGFGCGVELVDGELVRLGDVARPLPLQAFAFLAGVDGIIFEGGHEFLGFSWIRF